MSILIKGMEMPQNCRTCPMLFDGHNYRWCNITGESLGIEETDNGRNEYCPLIEVPPHGRLIDADKFEFEMNDKLLVALTEKYGEEEAQKGLHFSFRDCISNIQFQPTVIEAEGERDMMDEEIRQALNEVREMKQMCGKINMKLTNIVTQRGQDIKKKLEAEYQRGFEDGKAVSDKGCEGCRFEGTRCTACENCCNSHMNHWTAKQTDDKIEVGDEVAFHHDDGRPDTVVVVTYIGQDGFIDGMDGRGTQYAHKNPTKWTKTGRHFDISSILKEMQS